MVPTHGVVTRDYPGYPGYPGSNPTPTPAPNPSAPTDPTSYYSYGIAEMQLHGPPVYSGDCTIEFTRSLAGQTIDVLAVDDSSPAGVTTSETQLRQTGDWNIHLAQNVLPSQARTVQHLIPQTSYQIKRAIKSVGKPWAMTPPM